MLYYDILCVIEIYYGILAPGPGRPQGARAARAGALDGRASDDNDNDSNNNNNNSKNNHNNYNHNNNTNDNNHDHNNDNTNKYTCV